MSAHVFQNNFNSGELSPLLDGRVDLDQYKSGCRTFKNCIPLPFGGAISRPGLQYLGPKKDDSKKARLASFNFSTTTNYILEFGHQYIRFWTNGGLVGAPTELATPYTEAHLFELYFRQINDVVYIAHPNYPLRKVTRGAGDVWSTAEVAFVYPPLMDENITSVTLQATATTGVIALGASHPVFDIGHLGAYFEIRHTRAESHVDKLLTSDGSSSGIYVIGKWDFYTFGAWGGKVLIQRSLDGSTWETIRSFSSNQDRNVTVSGEESALVQLRVTMSGYTGHSATTEVATPRAVLEITESEWSGLVRIDGFTSNVLVGATVIRALYATTTTTKWAEGAWSTYRGHPRTVDIHEQRLVCGGNYAQPTTIWGSVSGDLENFRRTTNDDGSFAYTFAATEANAINWLSSQEGLIIGTGGEEWLMQAASSAEPITPTNVTFRRQSRYGSAYIMPAVVNDTVLFAQRAGRKIRELKYSFTSDSYVAPDLSLLSEHLTRSGIVQLAYQSHPDSVLWAVTSDGQLIGMTYERDQNVVAWHRHETDGLFESVAVLYGDPPGSDEVYVIVKRTINGATKRYLERMMPLARNRLEAREKEASFYVDCGTDVEGAVESSTVSGLDWLEGKTVAILADGAVQPSRVVSGGIIPLDRPARRVVVGLPYTAEVQPMKVNLDVNDGTSQGRKQRVNRAVFRLWNTLGLEWCSEPGKASPEWRELPFRDTDDPIGESPPLFTGDKEVSTGGGFDRSIDLAVRQTQPLPLGLLGIVIKFEVHGS